MDKITLWVGDGAHMDRVCKKASRAIVLDAVSEIRPPLISATLAVIASFLPLLFISGSPGFPVLQFCNTGVPVLLHLVIHPYRSCLID